MKNDIEDKITGKKVTVSIVGPSKNFLSGISYFTIRLANSLCIYCDVSVICYRNLLPRFLFPGRAHINKEISNLEFLPKVQVYDKTDYNNPITWYRAYRHLKKTRPDFIILQWWTSSVSHMHIILKLIGLSLKSKIIIEFHEVVDPLEESIFPLRIYSRLMGKILMKNLNTYIVHSTSDKFLVAKRYEIDLQKIHVIPHGLYDHYGKVMDKKKARELLSIKEEIVILSFGLIRRYKGIPYLIKAFEQLPESVINRTRLLIVGEIWEDKEYIINQIKSSPFKEKITLVNEYVSDDKVPTYFSAANILVLPYTRASQSGVAHIAMSFGKPIIASDVGGLKESLGRYPGTIFVPPKDIEKIKNSLLSNIDNEKIYNPPTLGWDEISNHYLKLIACEAKRE